MKNVLKTSLFVFLMMLCVHAQAQKYNYYQIFMYNFTKYIQWPEESLKGDFVIGVLGNNELVGNLEKMAESKTVGNQKIRIQVLNSPSDAANCHMVFIPDNRSKMFEDVNVATEGKPVLVITEKQGLGNMGSSINFIVVDGKLKFELNRGATEKANLKVAGDLAKLAILI
ncbi:MAG: YfiR family protein [Cyclobacteriaceae bacterium]|nr:YfiR family protein [Cyclobacteriaceae bacterium]